MFPELVRFELWFQYCSRRSSQGIWGSSFLTIYIIQPEVKVVLGAQKGRWKAEAILLSVSEQICTAVVSAAYMPWHGPDYWQFILPSTPGMVSNQVLARAVGLILSL